MSTRGCCLLAINVLILCPGCIMPLSIQGDSSTAELYPRTHSLPLQALRCRVHAGHVAVSSQCMHHLRLWYGMNHRWTMNHTVKSILSESNVCQGCAVRTRSSTPETCHTAVKLALLTCRLCQPRFLSFSKVGSSTCPVSYVGGEHWPSAVLKRISVDMCWALAPFCPSQLVLGLPLLHKCTLAVL